MDLFEKEGGRGGIILISLSVQIKTPLEMHVREKILKLGKDKRINSHSLEGSCKMT